MKAFGMSDWLSWNSLYSYKKQFNQEMPFKTENCNSDLLTYCMSYSLKNVRAFTKVNKFFKAISDFFFFNLNSPWNKKSTYFINASYLSYCDLFITDFGFFPLFFITVIRPFSYNQMQAYIQICLPTSLNPIQQPMDWIPTLHFR